MGVAAQPDLLKKMYRLAIKNSTIQISFDCLAYS
jgi:hypothetical protein